MTLEDARLTRTVQREVVKRHVDITWLVIKVIDRVCYLSGRLRNVRGMDIDLKGELEIIIEIVKKIPGIRDVVNEVDMFG